MQPPWVDSGSHFFISLIFLYLFSKFEQEPIKSLSYENLMLCVLNKISLKKLFMDIGGQRGGVRSLAPPPFRQPRPHPFRPTPFSLLKDTN